MRDFRIAGDDGGISDLVARAQEKGLDRHEFFLQAFALFLESIEAPGGSSRSPVERASRKDIARGTPKHPTIDDSSDDIGGSLSSKRLAILRQRLLESLAVCRERLKVLRNAEIESHDKSLDGDDADVAELGIERANRQSEMVRIERQIRELSHAISKMASGAYGLCEETGEPIGFARLLANPTARLSIHAQERMERGRRMAA